MVLAEYLDNQKKREVKDDIETVMNLVELPLLNQTTSNSIISTTSNDLSLQLVKTLQFMAASLWYQLLFH